MKPVVAENVRRSYGSTTAVDGVSVAIERGEVFALVGPNGAGKTTFVRCLTGTARLDSGTVRLFGVNPESVPPSRIGLLPQAFSPPDRLTARELLTYFAGLYDEARDPDAVLEEVGLDPDDDTWYENLSGGQQRRTAVATTLMNDPDLLFLDEPTTGIDPEGRLALWELFERLSGAGRTIFLTTHDMTEAERLADRVGLLANGRLVEAGKPRRLVEKFGGPNRLVVETDASPDALGDLAYDVLGTDDGFVIRDIDPTEIGTIVDALDARDVGFDALSWREPSLEDAYLTLANDVAAVEVSGR